VGGQECSVLGSDRFTCFNTSFAGHGRSEYVSVEVNNSEASTANRIPIGALMTACK